MSSLFPVPTVLRYRYPNNSDGKMFVLEESAEENISYFQRDGPRLGMAILCAVMTLFASATGYHNALALVSTAWVLSGMTAFVGPSMSIRGCAFLLFTFQVRRCLMKPSECCLPVLTKKGHNRTCARGLCHLSTLLSSRY